MNLIPILHRVLVKPKKLDEANPTYKRMKDSGFIIPETYDAKREEKAVEIGRVIAIGETAFTGAFATDIQPVIGDIVYFAKYAGKEIKEEDEILLILNDEDIVGVFTE